MRNITLELFVPKHKMQKPIVHQCMVMVFTRELFRGSFRNV